MSINASLRSSARSAYRAVLRAAASTFSGDPTIHHAFIAKTRQDFINARGETDQEEYTKKVQFAREVADVLRKNFVQGKLQSDGTYRLQITKDTELGSNETIKDPAPMEIPPRRRKRCSDSSDVPDQTIDIDNIATVEIEKPLKMHYSQLKKASKEREIPVLNEDDLEEAFIRGGGPGGQSINKTANNVSLLHKPTGMRITCQETRSLQENRRIARKRLLKKLDAIQNPGLSKAELKDAKERERKRQRAKKARKKHSKQASQIEEDDDN